MYVTCLYWSTVAIAVPVTALLTAIVTAVITSSVFCLVMKKRKASPDHSVKEPENPTVPIYEQPTSEQEMIDLHSNTAYGQVSL